MKEKPIPFDGRVVRAILAGQKTQTRQVVKPQPVGKLYSVNGGPEWAYPDPRDPDVPDWDRVIRCPYGDVGNRLWVQEVWNAVNTRGVFWDEMKSLERPGQCWATVLYRALEEQSEDRYTGRYVRSNSMPRALSRISLEITAVRVERVQDITEEDARAEGMKVVESHLWRPLGSKEPMQPYTGRQRFSALWDAINEARGYSWESNPWVWVVEFKRVLP